MIQCMRCKRNCWDNAVTESLYKTLKTEWVYKQIFVIKRVSELSVFQ